MRALIVDDAPLLATVLAAHVEALGSSVVGTPADVAAATRDAAALAPDVIFVDGRLPGGGLSAVAALRVAAPAAAIVVVVALHETALVRRFFDAGASDMLFRPYVRSRIASVLEAQRARS